MRRTLLLAGTALVMLSSPASSHAQQIITFNADPFAGSNARETPGRQIVGNELFTPFNIGTDVFAFNQGIFGMGDVIKFASGPINEIPQTDVNAIVLNTFDNDGDPLTPFLAGTAANLIAERVTTSGAGVFIYFNSGLDLARLVYSTDLSDNTADLKILARLTNVAGESGREQMATFTEENFRIVPEPATPLLLLVGLAGLFARKAARNMVSL